MDEEKNFTCDTLREKHALLKEQGNVCGRFLVQHGPLSEKFIESFFIFEEKKEEFREIIEKRKKLITEKVIGVFDKQFNLLPAYGSGEEYLSALKEKGYHIDEYTEKMLLSKKFEESLRQRKLLTVVRITGSELGIRRDFSTEEIITAAEEKGLRLCPVWVIPQFRMQCGRVFAKIATDSLSVFYTSEYPISQLTCHHHNESGKHWGTHTSKWLFVSENGS